MTARRMSGFVSLRQRAARWPSRACCVGESQVAKGVDCDFWGDEGGLEDVDEEEEDGEGDDNGLVREVEQIRCSRPAST